jgi:transcriptional regulator with XRE-family HTH domain
MGEAKLLIPLSEFLEPCHPLTPSAKTSTISPQYLSWIAGGHQGPSVEMLAKLADTLDVELWDFYDFGQRRTIKEFRGMVWKVTQGANEEELCLALKAFLAGVR